MQVRTMLKRKAAAISAVIILYSTLILLFSILYNQSQPGEQLDYTEYLLPYLSDDTQSEAIPAQLLALLPLDCRYYQTDELTDQNLNDILSLSISHVYPDDLLAEWETSDGAYLVPVEAADTFLSALLPQYDLVTTRRLSTYDKQQKAVLVTPKPAPSADNILGTVITAFVPATIKLACQDSGIPYSDEIRYYEIVLSMDTASEPTDYYYYLLYTPDATYIISFVSFPY